MILSIYGGFDVAQPPHFILFRQPNLSLQQLSVDSETSSNKFKITTYLSSFQGLNIFFNFLGPKVFLSFARRSFHGT